MTSTASHSAAPPPHGRPAPGTGTVDTDGTLPVGPAGPCGPWTVRKARATGGRAALEVYEDGELVDVLVAARLAPQLLRGGRRGSAGGTGAGACADARYGLAWGRLPQDGAVPAVRFTSGWPAGRAGQASELVTVDGEFWLAWASGRFTGVLVEHAGRCERRPLARVRGRGAR
ncbi:hypothetical protein OH807_14210 [Kitasatospora sp. NBC_01560]|uniref:hypothetical protein n=1 Tax=Kitasatospora sp. NBC_01560 TaxID=2975965 RepID=UPI00386CFEEC